MGPFATRPVRPEYPDASSGRIEGPTQLSLGVGPTPALGAKLRAPFDTRR